MKTVTSNTKAEIKYIVTCKYNNRKLATLRRKQEKDHMSKSDDLKNRYI